jgi:hypothetical protein
MLSKLAVSFNKKTNDLTGGSVVNVTSGIDEQNHI